MAIIKNIVATVGEYTNSKGETKKKYINIGTYIEKEDNKVSIHIDCIPTGWDGWAGVYEQKEKESKKPAADEDLPF